VSQRVRPLLLVAALRPPNSDGANGAGLPEYHQLLAAAKARLVLDALAPEEAIALVCRRLGVVALPEPVAQLIGEKAQGHPFFSEELAYALRDAGLIRVAGGVCQLAPEADLHALAFPDTVQGAIISRVDRLTATQQLTLKAASVIGRAFLVRTLQAVYPIETDGARLQDDLAALARLDITPLEAPEPELTYIFKHAITQDVVYNLMLFAQRRYLHRAVAEWYETTFGNFEFAALSAGLAYESTQHSKLIPHTSKLVPYYPLLAHHWGKAGVTAKAIDYLEKAGRNALAISALREARAAFEQALELLATSATDQPAALQRQAILTRLLGEAQHQLGEFAAACAALERSLALMRGLGDHDGMSDALSLLGRVATDMGAYAEARRHLEDALTLARTLGDRARTARALSNLGNIAMREASYAESEGYYQESLALFAALGDRPGTAQVLNGMGNGAIDRRMYDVARYCYEESLAIRAAIGDRWGVASCMSNLGWVAHLQGDFAQARARYEESLAIGRAIGDRRGIAIVLNNLGFTLCELHDDAMAAECFDEALGIASEIGATPLALEVLVGLARLRARAGQPEPAAELLGLALRHPASNSDVRIQIELFLGQMADVLTPPVLDAALARGSALELEAVVAEIVAAR
jgi:tetratricopeptide (TPR) repeat protein